ncbi:glycosyl transferase [Amycolatopsis antarctica]|uniref:Glycosyl transferase n=1 Tax=Amycolatopsis antarctica TaxID=1854586 RepID=A0A263DA19_9PSEU|nr:glycosyl transferase [Amycolatopsis antarctica]OZM74326.1 glycosyl transferase [Amycolatopsis antarctica]
MTPGYAPAAAPAATASGGDRRPWRFTLADAAVLAGYTALAFVVLGPLWTDLSRGYLDHSMQDQHMWEWFFAVTAKNVVNLDNPFFTTLQNHPAGVNLMANTVMLGIGVPLTPVTVVFGPTATWAVALTGGLAATAAAWYWVISRHFVASRCGAAIGGAFCAFAPPIISHANAHPNFVVLFVLPLIAARVVRLARGARPVRDGVVLGLLLAYQIFLGEEPLLIGATTFAVFAGVYAVFRPTEVAGMLRPLGVGLGVGAAVTLALVAFPLWWQFFGPQGYSSLEHGLVGNDLAAVTGSATESLAGDPRSARDLSMNRTEENAFFGWPLAVLMLVLTGWLWRSAAARALSVTMLVMVWLSLGALVMVNGTVTSVPGPWMLLFDKPLFESVLESRFAIGAVPVIGVLLAMAIRKLLDVRPSVAQWRTPVRMAGFAVLAVALLPVAPTPLEVARRDPTPRFFTEGAWRDFVDPGGSVVVVPLPDAGDAEALSWQVDAGLEFPLAEGYFVGPGADGKGGYGAVRRPTSSTLDKVGRTGSVPALDSRDRRDALADLRFWDADVIVLGPQEHDRELRDTLELLLRRPPRELAGVWVWDVRELTR